MNIKMSIIFKEKLCLLHNFKMLQKACQLLWKTVHFHLLKGWRQIDVFWSSRLWQCHFENARAVAKVKLDPDKLGYYPEECVWVLKKLCLKTAATCPTLDGPCSFSCMSSEMLVSWKVVAPRTPAREKRLRAVLLKWNCSWDERKSAVKNEDKS